MGYYTGVPCVLGLSGILDKGAASVEIPDCSSSLPLSCGGDQAYLLSYTNDETHSGQTITSLLTTALIDPVLV